LSVDWKKYDLAGSYTVLYIADDHRGYLAVGDVGLTMFGQWIFWSSSAACRESGGRTSKRRRTYNLPIYGCI